MVRKLYKRLKLKRVVRVLGTESYYVEVPSIKKGRGRTYWINDFSICQGKELSAFLHHALSVELKERLNVCRRLFR
jgi:5-carboxymethyl-2-hydroxymuconate isomerase